MKNLLRISVVLAWAAIANAQEFRFEVISITPMPAGQTVGMQGMPDPTADGFYSTRATVRQMIAFAYGEPGPIWMWNNNTKMRNDPRWFTDYYDIRARVAQGDLKAWRGQSSSHEMLRAAVRAALKERCKLAIHEAPSQEPVFELVVAKGSPKLKASPAGASLPVGAKLESGGVLVGIGPRGEDGLNFHSGTMRDLADQLSRISVTIPVRDKTGLSGRYDFVIPHVQTSADEERVSGFPVEQLGLKLRRATENRPIIVIDHAEKPAAN